MYDVNTHVTVSDAAPRLAAMCGSATLAIVESSTVMNDASMTTHVTSAGLTGLAGAVGNAADAIYILLARGEVAGPCATEVARPCAMEGRAIG